MTPEQRRDEIALLLANALARLRITGTEQSANRAEASGFGSLAHPVPQAFEVAGIGRRRRCRRYPGQQQITQLQAVLI
jgi:hypothetical protein